MNYHKYFNATSTFLMQWNQLDQISGLISESEDVTAKQQKFANISAIFICYSRSHIFDDFCYRIGHFWSQIGFKILEIPNPGRYFPKIYNFLATETYNIPAKYDFNRKHRLDKHVFTHTHMYKHRKRHRKKVLLQQSDYVLESFN